MYQLRLVQAVDGLDQRVIVAVAPTAHRGLNTGFGQALAVANADVLRTPVAMMNQGVVTFGLAGV